MSFGHADAVGDSRTGDLLPDHDLAGERPQKPTRLARYRDRHGLAGMTVNIPRELLAEFNAYLAKTGKTRNEVIAHVLRTQVLRKR